MPHPEAHTGVVIGRLTVDEAEQHWAQIIVSCTCCGEWVLRMPAIHVREFLLALVDLHEDRPDLTSGLDDEEGE
jgi:hypothetical protein